ncbi:MAG: hypothetical protein WCZ43_12605, partial [Proteiniphilum sp.]
RERIDSCEIAKTVCENYISKKTANELISAKNDEINWLKEEVKYLRQKIDELVVIISRFLHIFVL